MSSSLLRSASFLAAGFACLSLTACGGGGGNNDGLQELTIESTANLDGGTVFNNNGSVNTGSSAGACLVGDDAFVASGGTLMRHSLWSFDISGLPAGATIQSAILRLFQSATSNNPQGALAIARLDHVNYGNLFPSTATSFSILTANIDTISDLNTANVAKLLDVTTAVQADVNASRPRSQFQLRPGIGTNNDAFADFMVFTDGETADPSIRPMLIITYEE
ncbi:MAG: DNRLRE domain-containing protein [Planctomycetota bacterium]